MPCLTNLPNIGKALAEKLINAGVKSEEDLKALGSENAIIRIATIDRDVACIHMLYALEGAIQGIRWHNLDKERKRELSEFYQLLK